MNATRLLEDGEEYYGDFLAYTALVQDKAVVAALEEHQRLLLEGANARVERYGS